MTTHTGNDNWVVEDLSKVRGVRHVIVLTADGLPAIHDDETSAEDAETVAAACAGLTSLARSMSTKFGASETVRQVMVDFDGGYLFVRGADDGSRLAVVTAPEIDGGLIAQEMQGLVNRFGPSSTLSAPSRTHEHR